VTAKEYVLAQVDRHNAKMGFFALVVIVFVLTLAMLLSRLFTRNIAALAGAVRSVAKGDFSARADVGGTDEIGQLGQAFNGMVPELQERVALKNALEVAQQVQQSLLPGAAPDFAGADIAAASEYCDETGGDYYDFIPYGNNGEDGGESLVIAVGDVSGHGIPAALMMSSARAYLHCQNRRGQSLDQVAETVNGLLHADMDMSGRFMTLFLLELTHGGPLRWVRAGHDPALLYDPARDSFRELDGQGLPLGVVEVAGLELCEEPSPPSGAVIAVGTDGIWERRSPDGKMFGKERMRDVIRAHADEPAREIIRALLKELEEFGGRTEQEDDITIVIVKTA
jgi:sigma-B regulation protein RsbU (phosphoserine phosphatase)